VEAARAAAGYPGTVRASGQLVAIGLQRLAARAWLE
jgi:hypothetical protein